MLPKKEKPALVVSFQEEGVETRRLICDKRFTFEASRAASAGSDVGEIKIARNGATNAEPFKVQATELDALIAGLTRVRDEMLPRLRSYGAEADE